MGEHIGFRAVHADFTSSRGYRWPFPGQRAYAPGPLLPHTSPCPQKVGDGLCVAKNWAGAAQGSIPAITCLVIGYHEAQVLGQDAEKVRVSFCEVLEVLDVPLLIRQGYLQGADLRKANLQGADLRRADLQEADLREADLRRADLQWADLRAADLRRADLRRADLRAADLQEANLQWADLRGADLRRADLRRADLRGAILLKANLQWANLFGANLLGADLRWALGTSGGS